VVSNDFESGLVLSYDYDPYGNMESRETNASGEQKAIRGPSGLTFVSRTYGPPGGVDNRISNANFEYDDNGNLVEEPVHENVGGFRYSFSQENQLRLVRDVLEDDIPPDGLPDRGTIYQESQYDEGGNRWVRVVSNDGGRALITLRDSSGQVAAEYEEFSATSALQPRKEYVRGNGKLMAVKSACGPAPSLSLVSLTSEGVQVRKTDFMDPTGYYTVWIKAEGTYEYSYTLDQNSPDEFLIDFGKFSGNPETNWIHLEAQVTCGSTGHGNGVSFIDKTSMSCVTNTALGNADFNGDLATLEIEGDGSACPSGYRFKAWYYPEGGGTTLLADNLQTPSLTLPNTPVGAGHGHYTFVEYDPSTGAGPLVVPMVMNDERNSHGEAGELPGVLEWNRTEYIHSDHLGSTRLVTDEAGAVVSSFKYYPFGHYADTSSGSDVRMKFTGHERDEELSLDYMLARYCGPNLARFLSVDPLISSAKSTTPQSWNRYTYVLNSPSRLVDPDGREYVDETGKHMKTETEELGNDSQKEVVNELDASPIKVSTVVSPKAAAEINDSEGNTVAGTFRTFDATDSDQVRSEMTAQLKEGQTLQLREGSVSPVVDGATRITIFGGTFDVQVKDGLTTNTREQWMVDVFAHESEHPLKPGGHEDFRPGIE
jgi:RHS repeat-associated protein